MSASESPAIAEQARRAALTLGVGALVVGLVAVVVAWDSGFSSSRSQALGWPQHELGVLRFNVAGALVTAGLGALVAAGAFLRQPLLVLAAAAGFALVAIQALLQAGRATNALGSSGSNLGLALGMVAALAATEWARANSMRSLG